MRDALIEADNLLEGWEHGISEIPIADAVGRMAVDSR